MCPLFVLGFLLLALPTVDADPKSEPATKGPECVILLHGLGRTSRSLNKMADALQAAGFRAVNLDYPSRNRKPTQLLRCLACRRHPRNRRRFLVLPYSHPFIMNAEEVIDQTLHFLRGGRFGAGPPSAEGSSD